MMHEGGSLVVILSMKSESIKIYSVQPELENANMILNFCQIVFYFILYILVLYS